MSYTIRYINQNDEEVHETTPHHRLDDAAARRIWLIVNGISRSTIHPQILENGKVIP